MSKHNRRTTTSSNNADTPADLTNEQVEALQSHVQGGTANDSSNDQAAQTPTAVSDSDVSSNTTEQAVAEQAKQDLEKHGSISALVTAQLSNNTTGETATVVGNTVLQPAVEQPPAGQEYLSAFDREKLNAIKTTSGKIRYLASCGLTRGQIARVTGKLYQHVRNVLITPIKGQ